MNTVALFNKSKKPVLVKEIGMTVFPNKVTRPLTQFEATSITSSYPDLVFVYPKLEAAAKKVKVTAETKGKVEDWPVFKESDEPVQEEPVAKKRKYTKRT